MEVADPARFREAMAEQEWRMRVRLSDKLYDWLEKEQRGGDMVDITMCQNSDCPLNVECYRYMATPDKWQSYGDFKWNNKCEFFWPIRERKCQASGRGPEVD